MSILDKFRGSASKAKHQAEHVVEQHGDKISGGIDKTGEVASRVTGHRFDDKIDKGVSKAKERIENHGGQAEGGATGSEQPPSDQPPSDQPKRDDSGTA